MKQSDSASLQDRTTAAEPVVSALRDGIPSAEGRHTLMRVWSCKIGTRERINLPMGADSPMRKAVFAAFRNLTGMSAEFNFSGWGAELDESELAVVEDREPSAEHCRLWRLQEHAPELLRELQNAVVLLEAAGVVDSEGGTIAAARAVIAKAQGTSASGQDAKQLEAKPAGPVGSADAPGEPW